MIRIPDVCITHWPVTMSWFDCKLSGQDSTKNDSYQPEIRHTLTSYSIDDNASMIPMLPVDWHGCNWIAHWLCCHFGQARCRPFTAQLILTVVQYNHYSFLHTFWPISGWLILNPCRLSSVKYLYCIEAVVIMLWLAIFLVHNSQ